MQFLDESHININTKNCVSRQAVRFLLKTIKATHYLTFGSETGRNKIPSNEHLPT